jgi:RNA polymerase sigma-70 factor (ECF subfamily)
MDLGVELPRRTASGNQGPISERAFAEMYPRLRRFAASFGEPWMEPDDLVQEALARALQQHRDLEGLRDPETYLLKSIANLVRNERRTRTRSQRPLSTARDSDSTRPSYPHEVAYLLDLQPEARTALVMIDLEGFTYQEAARVLDTTAVALRARVSRARRQVRKHLEDGV